MAPFPRLVASPGMPFEAIAAASDVPMVEPAPGADVGYTQPEGPHVWVLRVGDTDIEFPASRFTTLEIAGGRAVRIHCTLSVDYLYPEPAAALTARVRERLRGAGFIEADIVPPDRITGRLPAEGEVRACRFRAGEWMGELRVKRMIEAKSPAAEAMKLEEDACLVSCALWDVRGAAALIG